MCLQAAVVCVYIMNQRPLHINVSMFCFDINNILYMFP